MTSRHIRLGCAGAPALRAILPALSALLAAWGTLAACSSSTDDGVVDVPDSYGVVTAPTDAQADRDTHPADGEAGTPTPPPDAAPSGDAVCAAEAKRTACTKCCQTNHAAGFTALTSATLACACGAAVCAPACAATACAATPTKPDAACQQCIDASLSKKDADAGDGGPETGACTKDVKDACTGNADCVSLTTCEAACKK